MVGAHLVAMDVPKTLLNILESNKKLLFLLLLRNIILSKIIIIIMNCFSCYYYCRSINISDYLKCNMCSKKKNLYRVECR